MKTHINFPVKLLFCASLAYGLVSNAFALTEQEFKEANSAYLSFVVDDKIKIDDPWNKFDVLNKNNPDHPVVQIYFGSLETLKARDAWMPWSKLKWVNQGLDRIDRALRLLEKRHDVEMLQNMPVSLLSRITAARTFLGVPSFLNRLQDGKDVFADILDSADVTQYPAALQKQIFTIGMEISKAEENQQMEEKFRNMIAEL